METQTALAVPDEDNCLVVYTSSQCPQFSHAVIAKCLGIPESNVRVITRRVGGGFGGKAVKSIPVSIRCNNIVVCVLIKLARLFFSASRNAKSILVAFRKNI